jgi:hypothetical protein
LHELARVVPAMAADAQNCPNAFQRLAGITYVVCSHSLAIRASHGGLFSPFGLSWQEVSSHPIKVRSMVNDSC